MAERSAADIRAYMAADMKLHDYLALVDVDLHRLLDAVWDLYGMVAHLYHEFPPANMADCTREECERFIDKYAPLGVAEPATETPGEQVLRHISETETWINGDLPKGAPATDGEEGGT